MSTAVRKKRELGINTIVKKLEEREEREERALKDVLYKLGIVEKLIMLKAKNVYEIRYEVDENIPDEEPNTISVDKSILANTYNEAIKIAKSDSEVPEEIDVDGKNMEITYTNFSLVTLKVICTIDLFG